MRWTEADPDTRAGGYAVTKWWSSADMASVFGIRVTVPYQQQGVGYSRMYWSGCSSTGDSLADHAQQASWQYFVDGWRSPPSVDESFEWDVSPGGTTIHIEPQASKTVSYNSSMFIGSVDKLIAVLSRYRWPSVSCHPIAADSDLNNLFIKSQKPSLRRLIRASLSQSCL